MGGGLGLTLALQLTTVRKSDFTSLYGIGAHVFLIIFSFAGQDSIPLYKELWHMLNTFDWMWPALAGFFLMIMAGVTSYKKARAKMSYETWWLLHLKNCC